MKKNSSTKRLVTLIVPVIFCLCATQSSLANPPASKVAQPQLSSQAEPYNNPALPNTKKDTDPTPSPSHNCETKECCEKHGCDYTQDLTQGCAC